MTLQKEIDQARSDIRTDGYPVSIGEWISLYQNEELDLHPEFQRFFRWSEFQKSRLIESILLGIPIPQIFVHQRKDGIWDVVDGLQRLSTIFEFIGILRDEHKQLLPPLELTGTKYLPSLEGVYWESSVGSCLTVDQRLLIKRSKIHASIILRESGEKTKYELFQRLNTGGSPLSDQEVRNSILVMLNRDLFNWIRQLSMNEDFVECISLSDRNIDEQYDMELVLRFIILREMADVEFKTIRDLGEFLTDKSIELAQNARFNRKQNEEVFSSLFSLLRKAMGSESFKRFNADKDKFQGGFSVSAFEAIAIGMASDVDKLRELSEPQVRGLVQRIWTSETFKEYSRSGVRSATRIPKLVQLGRKIVGEA
jgi:hypothetical protein